MSNMTAMDATLKTARLSDRQQGGANEVTVALVFAASAACFLAGWLPVGISIVAVLLFAGPHNWYEGRYMLGRMPARWGPLKTYFSTGIAGVLLLVASFSLLPWHAEWSGWESADWTLALAAWNTGLVAWILMLVHLRSRLNPRRDWRWVQPFGCGAIALAWLEPQTWDLALIYLHPLMALWLLDLEIGVHRPAWRAAYRRALAVVPALLILLWWQLAEAPSLSGQDALTARITAHAGADVLRHVSSHLLVSTHVFLETLHYGVWLIMIPLVSVRAAPWNIAQVPLARRSPSWRRGLTVAMALGGAAVVLIWAGFLSNYPLTRDVYFTVALLHVLAEIPFLLRLL